MFCCRWLKRRTDRPSSNLRLGSQSSGKSSVLEVRSRGLVSIHRLMASAERCSCLEALALSRAGLWYTILEVCQVATYFQI